MSENLNNNTKIPRVRVRNGVILVFFLCIGWQAAAQEDSLRLRALYDAALTRGKAYLNLYALCKEAPGRLSGSPAAEKAVQLTARQLKEAGADSVWLQPVMVPKWTRGEVEKLSAEVDGKTLVFQACALGNSVGTKGVLKAKVVMVPNLDALKTMPRAAVEGRIVFFYQAPDPKHVDTFHAYGGCAGSRLYGADAAAEKGAVAVVLHSLTLAQHGHAHTGTLIYKQMAKAIPGMALSPIAAKALRTALTSHPDLELHMEMDCKNHGMVPSFNVIGERYGREKPDEWVVVGGHLDSWDNGEGAHDDGAGVVHAIETIHLFHTLKLRPRRSVRAVLFMNEENGAYGAYAYAEFAKRQKHVFALESDRGGFTPRGFTIESDTPEGKKALAKMQSWAPLFAPYLIHILSSGGSGVDVGKMRGQGCVLGGFIPDSQRYFDHHHAPTDAFESVHKRELELGSAAIASLVWLVAEHGWD